MTPVSALRGGRGGNLTGYFNSQHMVSQYLPIHFIALNPIIKEIIGGLGNFYGSGGGGGDGAKTNNKGDIKQKPQISHL